MSLSASMLIGGLSMNTASFAYTFHQCPPVRAIADGLRWHIIMAL